MTKKTLSEQARIVAGMIALGEHIAFGRDTELLMQLADRVDALTKERDAWQQAHEEQVAKLIEIANERDALAAGGKLAAAALEKVHEAIDSRVNNYSRLLGDIAKAHDALKAGVQ